MDYYPGTESVDVLAFDCYGPFEQSYYDDLNALSDGKPLAIGETYTLPDLDTFRAQPKWAYYMVWAVDAPPPGAAERDDLGGPHVRALVSDPRMLSLDDPAYRAARQVAGLPIAGG